MVPMAHGKWPMHSRKPKQHESEIELSDELSEQRGVVVSMDVAIHSMRAHQVPNEGVTSTMVSVASSPMSKRWMRPVGRK